MLIDKEYHFSGLEAELTLADLFASINMFTRTGDGRVPHSYSCYGRDEDALPYPMAWLRRHDQYGE